MVPVAEWTLHAGAEVVKLVRRMEHGAGGRPVKVSPNVFRVLEGMYDPQDFMDLTRELSNEEQKLTASRLRSVATGLIRRRHWTWTLQHPDLGPQDVHPSRRMYPCSQSSVPCFVPCGC